MAMPFPLPRWLPEPPPNTPLVVGEGNGGDIASVMQATGADQLIQATTAGDQASVMAATGGDQLAG